MPPDDSVGCHALNVTEEYTVAPLSSVISPGIEEPTCLQGAIEGAQHLFLIRQMCVARGIAELHRSEA